MKILFTFLTKKKNLFWTNKKFIFINKLSWYHPKIMYKNIVQKDMSKFLEIFVTTLEVNLGAFRFLFWLKFRSEFLMPVAFPIGIPTRRFEKLKLLLLRKSRQHRNFSRVLFGKVAPLPYFSVLEYLRLFLSKL